MNLSGGASDALGQDAGILVYENAHLGCARCLN
jgi:hypothetical protein